MRQFESAVAHPSVSTPKAYLFMMHEGRLLLEGNRNEPLVSLAAYPAESIESDRHYLGRLDGIDCWAQSVTQPIEGWRAEPLRAAMMAMSEDMFPIAACAAQILEWDRTHRFCGVCGATTRRSLSERARVCPSCEHTAYPRISPAMMALVWREGEILLARSHRLPQGMYSALAGFVEPGETIEDCVVREVKEEVGVSIADLAYYGSQSWPFPHSLMLAFTARWVSGEIVPQPEEIEHAAWFPLDNLPDIPPRFSISGHLIRDTIAQLKPL